MTGNAPFHSRLNDCVDKNIDFCQSQGWRGSPTEKSPMEELPDASSPSGYLPFVENGTEQGILLKDPIEGKEGILRKEQTS